MVDFRTFQKMALSFPKTSEQPHFEKTSFRVGKKIFATYEKQDNSISIKLNEIDQNVFSAYDKTIIYPVPNKWGKQGWTIIQLNLIKEEMLLDALTTAYCAVAPKNLSKTISGFNSL